MPRKCGTLAGSVGIPALLHRPPVAARWISKIRGYGVAGSGDRSGLINRYLTMWRVGSTHCQAHSRPALRLFTGRGHGRQFVSTNLRLTQGEQCPPSCWPVILFRRLIDPQGATSALSNGRIVARGPGLLSRPGRSIGSRESSHILEPGLESMSIYGATTMCVERFNTPNETTSFSMTTCHWDREDCNGCAWSAPVLSQVRGR